MTILSDNFNRASLGSDWAVTNGGMAISGNAVTGTMAGYNIMRFDRAGVLGKQHVQAKECTDNGYVLARFTSLNNMLALSIGGAYTLFDVVNGGWTQRGQFSRTQAGQQVGIRVDGMTMNVTRAGVALTPAATTVGNATGYAGLGFYGTGFFFDDFSVDDMITAVGHPLFFRKHAVRSH